MIADSEPEPPRPDPIYRCPRPTCGFETVSKSDHEVHLAMHRATNYDPAFNVTKPRPDPINPAHYKGDYVMRILEDFGLDKDFCLGNVVKYILRSPEHAAGQLEQLRKAHWYLERKIKNLE